MVVSYSIAVAVVVVIVAVAEKVTLCSSSSGNSNSSGTLVGGSISMQRLYLEQRFVSSTDRSKKKKSTLRQRFSKEKFNLHVKHPGMDTY